MVKKTSPFMKLADMKGKKRHIHRPSNSGHMAPLALFPSEGLTPDKDYKISVLRQHDQSVMACCPATTMAPAVVFRRVPPRAPAGRSRTDFRIIYRSQKFPTSSFAYAHDLDPNWLRRW